MDALAFEQLQQENQRLRERIAQLEELLRELHERLEASERTAKRQAAPFAKKPPQVKPKKPGRKSGEQHGRHAHRPPPPPEHIDETLDAALPEQCPQCGGAVVEDHTAQQFQSEIVRRPLVRQITIHCGHCQGCGKKLRGRHPLQTSTATGAAQSQLGADAQAAVVYLNKHAGLSHGKIADTLATVFGLSLTRGASAQIVLRAGHKLKPTYDKIKEQIITAEHLTPDETGWRVGGHPAWLHAWVGGNGATLYTIDPQRSADVLEQVIGLDWSGSMTHDGFSSYERFDEAIHQQCVDHALRRARKLVQQHTGMAKVFPQQVIDLFTGALRTRDELLQTKADDAQRGQAHEEYLQRLLALTCRPRVNEANERFAKHLAKHGASWLMFLVDPTIPATNHRAEQALKTPIVNRKVWGGNRTERGSAAQAVIGSVLQTCKRKAVNAFTYFRNTFHGTLGNLFA